MCTALTVLATIFSMALYKIGMQPFSAVVYQGIPHCQVYNGQSQKFLHSVGRWTVQNKRG